MGRTRSTYWEDENVYRVFTVKVKFTLQQTTKDHRGELRYSSLSIISVLLDGVVVNATPGSLYTRENYPVPNVQEAG